MNILLIEQHQLEECGRVALSQRQAEHVQNVLKLSVGDSLKAGLINGAIGTLRLLNEQATTGEFELDEIRPNSPAPLPCRLVLALPRPKMLRRILQMTASLGIKKIAIINSYRVEKSFWGSPFLQAEQVREQLILGLEQGVDTLLPEVSMHKLFKPFVEDELPGWCTNTRKLVAHPYSSHECPSQLEHEVTLAIGPEGGFIPYEVEKLVEAGFEPVSLGNRIMRVETAMPMIVGRLFPLN